MRPFDLFRAGSLADAAEAAGPEQPIKAAGIDLLDRLKERVESPKTIVDISSLSLRGITRTETGLRIGALTTLATIARAPELTEHGLAALREAAGETATPQIRNRATLAGNLLQRTRCPYYRSAAFECAHSHPGNPCLARDGENRYHSILGTVDCVRVHPSNLAPPLIALGAAVEIASGTSTRRLPIAELYPKLPMAAAAEHVLAPAELVVAIHVPKATGRSAYRESREKQSFDWPTTSAAVALGLTNGTVDSASICLGAVGPVPIVAPAAAEGLRGKPATVASFVAAAKEAFAAAQPLRQNAYKVTVGQAVLTDALCAAAGIER